MPRYLVTGGGGFIGAAVARRLVERGDEVVILDNFATGDRGNVPADARLVVADIRDERCWTTLHDQGATGVEAVLHFAAQPSGEISHDDPLADFDTNARGTFLMLQWAARHGVRRILHASTMGVYGSADVALAEDRPLAPASYYGASKAAAESAVSFFDHSGGATTIFRMFNVFGPGQNLVNLRQGMASIYLAYVLRGEPVLVKGSLDRFRDLIYIDDVVDAWLRALDRPAAVGSTYNLGTGIRTTVRELVDAVIRAAGEVPGRYPVMVARGTAGDAHGTVANITRVTNDLGWTPRVPLDEGLHRMVRWARSGVAGSMA